MFAAHKTKARLIEKNDILFKIIVASSHSNFSTKLQAQSISKMNIFVVIYTHFLGYYQNYLINQDKYTKTWVYTHQREEIAMRYFTYFIKTKEEYFYLRSANKENIDKILNRLRLKKLPNIIPAKEIKNSL